MENQNNNPINNNNYDSDEYIEEAHKKEKLLRDEIARLEKRL